MTPSDFVQVDVNYVSSTNVQITETVHGNLVFHATGGTPGTFGFNFNTTDVNIATPVTTFVVLAGVGDFHSGGNQDGFGAFNAKFDIEPVPSFSAPGASFTIGVNGINFDSNNFLSLFALNGSNNFLCDDIALANNTAVTGFIDHATTTPPRRAHPAQRLAAGFRPAGPGRLRLAETELNPQLPLL